MTPEEDVIYLYDEQIGEDSVGYWRLEASGPYDTETGSKSRGVNDYPEGVFLEFYHDIAAFIVGEEPCMVARFDIDKNYLKFSGTETYYDEGEIDELYEEALDVLSNGGYIGGYYTTKDEDGDAVLILTLIVKSDDGYKWYDFSRFKSSETATVNK